ncbi:MAG: DNA-3-methyladenine glycosylase [Bacteroidales bacterium]|jgi:3-methyladenine DNA glycosylase Mpg|nr:DNA-3-methyladenine glycosylase [Bacteroidales bacterium]
MIKNFKGIENLIDEKGELKASSQEAKKESIKAIEELAESLLGCTLCIHGNKFVIRMLEIYYGGIGDDAHDYYRNRFVSKTSKCIERTEAQNKEGFRIYLKADNTKSYKRNRFDIVVGDKGVPASFLIRSVWKEPNIEEYIGESNGSPNKVLQAMGLTKEDHNKPIEIEDTADKIKKEKGLKVKRDYRINVSSKFEKENNLKWNFCLK